MNDAPFTLADLPANADQARGAIARFRADYAAVRAEVAKAVVGHDSVVDGVLTCLFCGGHALLEGVPGLGKTLLIRSLARSLSLAFSRVQFTPDLMPADVTGTTIVTESAAGQGRREFVFQPGPVFTQILLADEINRATPKTQSALLEAMQERSVTVAGTTHTLPKPFLVMATQNPIEQEGTYPLPEAQLDRFFYKLLLEPSGRSQIAEILDRTTAGTSTELRSVLGQESIVAYQSLVQLAAIAPHVQDYAVRMVLATHPRSSPVVNGREPTGTFATPMVNRYVRYGSSPRGAQALVLAAKCRALLDDRPAVSVDDLREAALPALRHRMILNFEAQADGVSADAVVRNIVETLPANAELPTTAALTASR